MVTRAFCSLLRQVFVSTAQRNDPGVYESILNSSFHLRLFQDVPHYTRGRVSATANEPVHFNAKL